MKRNKILGLAMTAFMFLSTNAMLANGADRAVFSDVSEDHWAKTQIEFFTEQGMIDGYGDGSFRPDEGVTREEFCKLLVSCCSLPLKQGEMPSFSDVSPDRWSYPYIETCREFLTESEASSDVLPTFCPEDYGTREDIAAMLVKMLGYDAHDAKTPGKAKEQFLDGDRISVGLLPYVSLACEKKLISGYPDGSFGPKQGVTRAEALVLLDRAMKQSPKEKEDSLPPAEQEDSSLPAEKPVAARQDALAVIKSISEGLDDAGDPATILTFFQGGEMKKLAVHDKLELGGFGKGDIFHYSTNVAGVISRIGMVYDLSEKELVVGLNVSNYAYVAGLVEEKDLGLVLVDGENCFDVGIDLKEGYTNVEYHVRKNTITVRNDISHIKTYRVNRHDGTFNSDGYVAVARTHDGDVIDLVVYVYDTLKDEVCVESFVGEINEWLKSADSRSH